MVQAPPLSPAIAAAVAVFLPPQGQALLDRPAHPAPPQPDAAPDPRLLAALRAGHPLARHAAARRRVPDSQAERRHRDEDEARGDELEGTVRHGPLHGRDPIARGHAPQIRCALRSR